MKPTATRKRATDASGTHLWLVLMKAHRTLQRLATRSIESSEAGLSDFAVMEMLLHKGPQPVSAIGSSPAHERSNHHGCGSTRVARPDRARGPPERQKGSHRSVDGGRRRAGGQDIRPSQGGDGCGSECALEDRARDAHCAPQEARHFCQGSSGGALTLLARVIHYHGRRHPCSRSESSPGVLARTVSRSTLPRGCSRLRESAATPSTSWSTSRISSFRCSTNRCRHRWASMNSRTRSGGPRRLDRWMRSSSSHRSTTTVFLER